ncbi:amidase [Pseudolabrys taiwanensis]|uniref:Indoleacetamide hydrolase n=1 Tax=Pseudolabrys taiwanensis TaxID=331696 RepID=A0A346A3K4_9HYPH|nr:amidase [Pseudolabrys taiwanensis]AXK83751.1 amidase [Pseudolabrys taiwanensis]
MSSSSDRLQAALARIDDPKGEGARACLTVYRDEAKMAAEAADARAKAGISLGPLDGAIVSIKDLLDVKGEITRAASKLVAEEGKPAREDAPTVRRLRRAGAVIVAKTNMSEFAFSGVGTNPHYGTPANPADRTRVPGGSSSGGAVAVADGMCEIAIGSDTGGSLRIPAALCGIVGFKPSRQRIPTGGAFPLSFSLDSIGPMANTVADCAKADAVLAGEDYAGIDAAPLAGLRVGIAQGLPLEGLDDTVAKTFPAALKRLEAAGVRLSEEKLPLIDDMVAVNAKGGLAPPEALMIHRDRLARRADAIDPNVAARIERAAKIGAADYVEMQQARIALVAAMDARLADVDVLVSPTTPIVAPTIAEVEDRATFGRKNALLLRNTSIWNFFDCCAISLPLPRESGHNTGLMLIVRNGHDKRLFRIAAAVEKLFAR